LAKARAGAKPILGKSGPAAQQSNSDKQQLSQTSCRFQQFPPL